MNELVLKGFILVEYYSDKSDETTIVTRRSCDQLHQSRSNIANSPFVNDQSKNTITSTVSINVAVQKIGS